MSLPVIADIPIQPPLPRIKEAALGYKILALLPMIGDFVQNLIENHLKKVAKASAEIPNVQHFKIVVNLKNQYKVLGIIRSVLEIAAMVAFLAIGILAVGLMNVALPIIFAARIAALAYNISRNNKMLSKIDQNGFGEVF